MDSTNTVSNSAIVSSPYFTTPVKTTPRSSGASVGDIEAAASLIGFSESGVVGPGVSCGPSQGWLFPTSSFPSPNNLNFLLPEDFGRSTAVIVVSSCGRSGIPDFMPLLEGQFVADLQYILPFFLGNPFTFIAA